MNINDPVVRFIENELMRQERCSEHDTKAICQYINEMYSGTEGLLLDIWCDLGEKDEWWIKLIWGEIKKKEQCDDAMIGLLIRQYVDRCIHSFAREMNDHV